MSPSRVTRPLIVVLSSLAAGVGLFAVVAWGFGAWSVLALGPGYAPVTPTTSLLLVVLGVGLAVSSWRPESAAAARFGCRVGAFVIAGVILCAIRSFLFPLPTTPILSGAMPMPPLASVLGVMSAWTAVVMLLAGVGLLHVSSGAGSSSRRRALATVNSCIGLLASLVFVLGYVAGTPVLYGHEGMPMSFLSAIGLLFIHTGLLLSLLEGVLLKDESVAGTASLTVPSSRASAAPLIAFAGVAFVVILSGLIYLRAQQTRARAVARQTLEAIGNLKVSEIEQWRSERLNEIRGLFSSSLATGEAQDLIRRPTDAALRARVTEWLEEIRGGTRYQSIRLYNPDGQPVVGVGEGPTGRLRPPSFAGTLTGGEIMLDSRGHDGTGPSGHLDSINVIAALKLRGARTVPSRAAGFVVLTLDPHTELFPLVSKWPLPSETAEAYLVERQGQEVVALSELRFRAQGSTPFRASIRDPFLTAAAAVRGEHRVIEGVDYRGVPAISASFPISSSPWVLVAEMDQAEAYAPVADEAWRTAVLVALVLAALGFAAAFFWRHRQSEYLRQSLEAEHESRSLAERLALVSQNANDAILLFDDHMRIVEANDRVLALYGRTPAAMVAGLTAADLRSAADRAAVQDLFRRVLGGEALVFEAVHARHDGGVFPVEVSARPVTILGRPHVLSVIRDITQRRAHEREIERLSRLYAALAHVNQSVAQAGDRDTLLNDACRSLVEAGGFRTSWIGWPDRESGAMRIVARGGDTDDYVDRLRITLDDSPHGRGPSGTAYREGRTVISNDFLNDANAAPWHQAAREAGFASAASIPILAGSEVTAVLTVYAHEPGYFGVPEVALLEQTARDVGFGLERLAREAAREAAEAERRVSDERLAATVNAIPDLLFELSRDGTYLSFHSPWTDLLAAPQETFLGRNVADILPPEGVEATRRAIAEADRAGRSYGHQFRLDLPQGPSWFELSVAKAPGASGEEARFVALSRDITDRKRAEEGIRESLREKEALLKEVHHRVKNNLQVITSLLRLEASRSHEDGTRIVLKDMQNRIRSMALLHETLYTTGDFAAVNLADYLRRLASQLFRAHNADPGQVRLILDLDPVPLTIDNAIPCGLIVNELITNTLKHAFAGRTSGEVHLRLHASGEPRIIELQVADNGVGLPQDFQTRRQASLGMQLVSDLTRQVRGDLEIGRGPGTTFTIRFPPDETSRRTGPTARPATFSAAR